MSAIYGDMKPGRVNKSAFNLSHERVLTCNMGQLVPVFNEFCYPNEDWKVSNNCVIRFNPLIHPLMHEVNATIHYFAIPMRLIYPKFDVNGATSFCFEDTITGGQDGTGNDMQSDFFSIKCDPSNDGTISAVVNVNGGILTINNTTPAGSLSVPTTPGGIAPTTGNVTTGMASPWFKRGSNWDYFRNAPALGTENAGYVTSNPTPTQHLVVPLNLDDNTMPIDALFRSYHFVWWEYYRDEIIRESSSQQGNSSLIWSPSLMAPVGNLGLISISGTNNWTSPDMFINNGELFMNPLNDSFVAEPKYRAYEKDYFTAAQVQAQRGTPGVVTLQQAITGSELPVVMQALNKDIPVQLTISSPSLGPQSNVIIPQAEGYLAAPSSGNPSDAQFFGVGSGEFGYSMGIGPISEQNGISTSGLNFGFPLAVGSGVLPPGAPLFDINTLRLAYSMQAFAEVQQRFGTRLTEWIYGVFGEAAQDSRLQRPEYLGGTKFPVVFSEVLQTSESSDSSALGDLGGHGMSVNGDFAFSYHTNEHCVILGLLSVMPRASYGQGVDRQFMFNNRYDFYNPAFAFIGEQGIYSAELYAYGDTPSQIFGYQAAYDQYRQRTNSYHGLMHTDLDTWHLGRKFSNTPELNTDFITTSTDDFKRAFAATDEIELQVAIGHNVTAIRPMPWNSVPHIDGLDDMRSGGM